MKGKKLQRFVEEVDKLIFELRFRFTKIETST